MEREQCIRIAKGYDTTISRAFLRALGIEASEPVKRGQIISVERWRERYAEILQQGKDESR